MILKVLSTQTQLAGSQAPSPEMDTASFDNARTPAHATISDETLFASFEGAAHKRFVTVSTLLSLIDPVRGVPTTHSLDRHPHDDLWRYDQRQKKFLDSFALICSTSRVGGETASAVCLEQPLGGHPSGNILRIARNLGVPSDLVDKFQEILDDLTAVALREKRPSDAEREILQKIIVLDQDKIRFHLERISHLAVQAEIERAFHDMKEQEWAFDEEEDTTNFRQWIHLLPQLVCRGLDADPSSIINYIKWASEARWVHSEKIESFLGSKEGLLPHWLKYVYKLGRYYAATKAMLKLAVTQPAFFTNIRVEAVQAPAQVKFSLRYERAPLRHTLKKITGADPKPLMAELGRVWCKNNPEAYLREACEKLLTVHAEMQLLSFYDHRPELTPRLLFMGTSKKACYLCHEFISRHPLSISVSATHQKLYPTWMPAPCSSAVRKKHKALLWEFSRHLEDATLRDLTTRLGIRRAIPLDSTDGPSLTSTASISVGPRSQALSVDLSQFLSSVSIEDEAEVKCRDGD